MRQWVYKDVYVAQMVELPETFHAPVEQVHKNLGKSIVYKIR